MKITGAQGTENLDETGREYSEKLQTLGRAVINALYMLVRSVKLYDPDNAVFQKPLAVLQESIAAVIARDNKLELMTVKDSFYLNGMLVRVDAASLDNVRQLIATLQEKDVGGLTLTKPATSDELKNFLSIFSKDQLVTPGEDGLAGKKLAQIKLTRWSSLKEKLSKEALEDPDDKRVDRKRYAMTLYARAVVFLEKYVEGVRKGKPVAPTQAMRIIQDLVDVCFENTTHLTGISVYHDEARYLVYHQVNTCLLCLVFGSQLGLTKIQLRELGLSALFHELGMSLLPPELLDKRAEFSPEEKALVARAPFATIRMIMMEKAVTKSTLLRLAAIYEYRQDFRAGTPQTLYSRILSLCSTFDALTSRRPYRDAYGPEIAMTLMWGELAPRFDPVLLKVFTKTMGNQPIKLVRTGQVARGVLTIGG